jgi:hypothetical protein
VEALTDDYLATSAGGITPIPVVVSELLDSAAAKAASVDQALTIVRVAKPSLVFQQGLSW